MTSTLIAYILIVIYKGSITMQEFNSYASCHVAAKWTEQQASKNIASVDTVCVPK